MRELEHSGHRPEPRAIEVLTCAPQSSAHPQPQAASIDLASLEPATSQARPKTFRERVQKAKRTDKRQRTVDLDAALAGEVSTSASPEKLLAPSWEEPEQQHVDYLSPSEGASWQEVAPPESHPPEMLALMNPDDWSAWSEVPMQPAEPRVTAQPSVEPVPAELCTTIDQQSWSPRQRSVSRSWTSNNRSYRGIDCQIAGTQPPPSSG